LYEAYLQQAFHYVRLSSSFTPLSARRMDPELLELRQWILHHSAHEMGHELMALDDLVLLGHRREDVLASQPLPGTWAWVNFFHYEVTQRAPIAAMGVLYFLEGMAAKLAPVVGAQLATSLQGAERKAVTFVQEHGELDAEHSEEGKDMLARFCHDPADADVLVETIRLGGHIKRFMLDDLVRATLG
jgi:pyrroloquinoline quinone (PQQ) biosynthesis protein C